MVANIIKNERGQTLITVLGAAILLSIIVLAIAQVMQFSVLANSDTDKRDNAMFIAEQILNADREDISAGHTLTYALSGTGTSTAWPGTSYSYIVQQYNVPGLSVPPTSPSLISQSTAFADRTKQLTLQSVVLLGGTPQLLAVTVYWGRTP
ncbi:hypothetical protein [Paenibacillus sp. SI8]|uniref:type IV pilus modification PilV family protein n=1 Tax=unclassified Paenibacillus TaxID=185978 RepID=UPI0034679613